jgi:cardiolipin synthase
MSARHRIWITSPYFVPDKHTHLVLRQRAQAGVDVRILVPNQHIDAKAVRWAAQASYQKLLDAGARIYEYQPTMIHSKSVVVDSIFSIVGSANMDVRSKELNEENVLGIVDRGFARELEAAFEKDIAQSIELDAEEWRHRGIGARALERVSGLFGEQY